MTTMRVAVEQIESMQASAKELLIADLKALRQEAGSPSLGELARLSHGKFSKSTLDDHLAGRRQSIPNWRMVAAYLGACQESAKATGLDIERLGTLEEWRIRWRAAQDGNLAAVRPVRDSKSVATYSIMDVNQQPFAGDAGPTISVSESKLHSVATTAGITAISGIHELDIQRLKKSIPTRDGALVVMTGSTSGACFIINGELATIGRDPESDIPLNDQTVSRRHAVIHHYGKDFTIRDVGSRNGTYLHQVRLNSETPLYADEQLQIGIFRMLFVRGTRRAAAR